MFSICLIVVWLHEKVQVEQAYLVVEPFTIWIPMILLFLRTQKKSLGFDWLHEQLQMVAPERPSGVGRPHTAVNNFSTSWLYQITCKTSWATTPSQCQFIEITLITLVHWNTAKCLQSQSTTRLESQNICAKTSSHKSKTKTSTNLKTICQPTNENENENLQQ